MKSLSLGIYLLPNFSRQTNNNLIVFSSKPINYRVPSRESEQVHSILLSFLPDLKVKMIDDYMDDTDGILYHSCKWAELVIGYSFIASRSLETELSWGISSRIVNKRPRLRCFIMQR